MFIIQYIIVLFTLLYVITYAYIKIKYPFWNNQPVYHNYDIWRSMYSEPFFIYNYRPIKTKFYGPFNVKTVPYLEAATQQKKEVLDLLRSNYISNDRILLTLQEKDLDASYAGHMETPYFSFYIEKNYRVLENLDISGVKSVEPLRGSELFLDPFPRISFANSEKDNNNRIIGCILSNPVKIHCKGSRHDKEYTELQLYYTDFLCVHRELNKNKKTKIIRELYDTHEYNQRLYNPAILGSLFKREIDLLEGIVPLVQYTTYIYYLRDVRFGPLLEHFQLVQITNETMDLLTDFMFTQTHLDLENSPHYELLSVTNLGNYVETIKQNMTYVFCLKKGSFVYAMYFFKDAKMQYEDLEGDTLQFYGSICNTDTVQLFYVGFLHAIHQIIKKFPSFKILMLENLGHNILLHKEWRKRNSSIFENKTAYYSFNWVHPGSPLRAENCVFL